MDTKEGQYSYTSVLIKRLDIQHKIHMTLVCSKILSNKKSENQTQ